MNNICLLLLVTVAFTSDAKPNVTQRFCGHGHDYLTWNGQLHRTAMKYKLCMDRSQWFWRQEVDCKPSKPGAIPVAGCNITGMHETTIMNRTHTGHIQPVAPGKVVCTLRALPESKQCHGAYLDASDCKPACGSGASCCMPPMDTPPGGCYAVPGCDKLFDGPCGGPPFLFLEIDDGATFKENVMLDGVRADHWVHERKVKGSTEVTRMHWYLQSGPGQVGGQHLLRTAYERQFDKKPGDGGHNITQMGIRDWSLNYTDKIPDSTFIVGDDEECKQVMAMDESMNGVAYLDLLESTNEAIAFV